MSTLSLGLILSTIITVISTIFAVLGVISYSGALLLIMFIIFPMFMVQQLKWNF
ncbi:hypothetical protein F887_00629 [Acinetobacter sp. NIPH 2100]|nr:hypothetical protein F887_00629 [Acinetobacter sp. NIPH 2100]